MTSSASDAALMIMGSMCRTENITDRLRVIICHYSSRLKNSSAAQLIQVVHLHTAIVLCLNITRESCADFLTYEQEIIAQSILLMTVFFL